MTISQKTTTAVLMLLVAVAATLVVSSTKAKSNDLDEQLAAALNRHGFTGRIGSSLEQRLGRKVDNQLADLGRNLLRDPIVGLNDANYCSGWRSATAGFGDTQSMAIGVDNNFIVGPARHGPRNQRRTPMAANTASFPTLMWNSRFASL